MIKPVGDRAILKVKLYIDKDGVEQVNQDAKVLESNVEGIKKGDTVFFNQYGAISVNDQRTKGSAILIVDAEDIYGLLK